MSKVLAHPEAAEGLTSFCGLLFSLWLLLHCWRILRSCWTHGAQAGRLVNAQISMDHSEYDRLISTISRSESSFSFPWIETWLDHEWSRQVMSAETQSVTCFAIFSAFVGLCLSGFSFFVCLSCRFSFLFSLFSRFSWLSWVSCSASSSFWFASSPLASCLSCSDATCTKRSCAQIPIPGLQFQRTFPALQWEGRQSWHILNIPDGSLSLMQPVFVSYCLRHSTCKILGCLVISGLLHTNISSAGFSANLPSNESNARKKYCI